MNQESGAFEAESFILEEQPESLPMVYGLYHSFCMSD